MRSAFDEVSLTWPSGWSRTGWLATDLVLGAWGARMTKPRRCSHPFLQSTRPHHAAGACGFTQFKRNPTTPICPSCRLWLAAPKADANLDLNRG
jgi:hypothetical protein